jgi:secondary thiamine-phosphate synthase enzyme
MDRTLTEAASRRQPIATSSGPALGVRCEALHIATASAPEFIDITNDVQRIIEESGVSFGQVTVFSTHTTAAIKLNENEPLLLEDMARILGEVAPRHGEYEHNDFSRRVNIEDDECANGHAHCQHLFLSTSETVPIIDGRMPLGTWQRIFFIELDHPRDRRVLVNVVGVGG